jgi:hypothetical protein
MLRHRRGAADWDLTPPSPPVPWKEESTTMTKIELPLPDEMTARFDELAQYAGQPRE